MRFLYIGRFSIKKDAASIRVKNIGSLLKKIGHTVDYLCEEDFGRNIVDVDNSRYFFALPDNRAKLSIYNEWLFGTKAFKKFIKMCEQNTYDAVILYNVTSFVENRFLKYCKERKIKVIIDVTEWYEVKKCKSIPIKILRFLVERRIKKSDKKVDGIISISSYLTNYYKSYGIPIIEIPPIFDYAPNYSLGNGSCAPTIIYAGNPSDKDEWHSIVSSVLKINNNELLLKMIFIGAPIPQNAKELEKMGIYFRPRCSNEKVIKSISEADFTVLFREKARFSMAGYSTKCAESLYNGIPVLCNNVGGADQDIENEFNGVKIDDLSVDSILYGFNKIINMKRVDIDKLKENCRAFGIKKFSINTYIKDMNEFVESLVWYDD